MSLAGDRGSIGGAEPAQRRTATPAAEANEPQQLPLRLSVARGALGVELSEPIGLGPVVLEELELSLLGVRFPLDLSRGVKQFHNRRAQLERALLRVDFDGLAILLRPHAETLLGEPLRELRLGPRGFGLEPEGEAGPVTPSVSVTLASDSAALGFDWVLCSGLEPRWLIDGARGVGLPAGRSALGLALAFVDAVMAGWDTLGLGLLRQGRAVELRQLARVLCLRVLPDLGFRLPAVGMQLVQRVEQKPGALMVTLDAGAEPLGVGRRGLRLSGLAELVGSADAELARGDVSTARRLYLEALERSPRQPEILAILAALDLAEPGHAEAALAWLGERLPDESWPGLADGLAADALESTGRAQAAREARLAATEAERDPLLAALGFTRLAQKSEDEGEQLLWLERALGRSPGFAPARQLRFRLRVRRADLRHALADAEQLDAALPLGRERAEQAAEFGSILLRHGFRAEAVSWLTRALRQEPSLEAVKLELADAFARGGEALRAIELLWTLKVEADDPLAEPRSFRLAQLLIQERLDASQAMALLRGVDSRGAHGAEARILEGRLAVQLADPGARVRAHLRLLEAVELGWIDAQGHASQLLSVAELELEQEDRELAQRALGLLRSAVVRGRPGPSGQAVDSETQAANILEERLKSLEQRLLAARE